MRENKSLTRRLGMFTIIIIIIIIIIIVVVVVVVTLMMTLFYIAILQAHFSYISRKLQSFGSFLQSCIYYKYFKQAKKRN